MIYFIQPVTGGPVKIGFTDDLDRRLVELENHYREPLAVLATVPGGRERETQIHDLFGHLRFGRTEQFRPAAEIFTFIGKPLLVSPNPDAAEAMKPTTVLTHIHPVALKEARLAASFLGVPLVEYLTLVVKEAANRDIDEGYARRKQAKPKG